MLIGVRLISRSMIFILNASGMFNFLGMCDSQSGLAVPLSSTITAKALEVVVSFPQALADMKPESYSPLAINSLFLAAVIQTEIVRALGSEDRFGLLNEDLRDNLNIVDAKENLSNVLALLRRFERRWKFASMVSFLTTGQPPSGRE